MATNFKLLQACSNNFLTTQIPDNFLDLDEFQQYQFLSTHAWQPVENLSPDNIWQLIESSADTMSTFFQQYVQAPHMRSGIL
ncbi:MAG: hypothetical protein KME09_07190 [Pleurocapsa minor HA4230-MV1]|jgi:hypothetical protein|nr:hypothetical protein [Pleurocapsa minor HA4230-MV1]